MRRRPPRGGEAGSRRSPTGRSARSSPSTASGWSGRSCSSGRPTRTRRTEPRSPRSSSIARSADAGSVTALMSAAEAMARAEGRWLLVLDTETGSAAEAFYRSHRLARGRHDPRLRPADRRTARPGDLVLEGPALSAGPRPAGRLTVVFAPDSFKGSLSSVEVARALAGAGPGCRPGDELLLAPLADGGEGTLAAIEACRAAGVPSGGSGPRPDRPPGSSPAGSARATASAGVVELAEASGLSRLGRDERDPLGASTSGRVSSSGPPSTTASAGSCWASAGAPRPTAAPVCCGPSVRTRRPRRQRPGRTSRTWTRGSPRPTCGSPATSTNPLLGPAGAAATYGPQKGATAAQVADLDRRLAAWADRLEAATGRRASATPRAPARPAGSASGCSACAIGSARSSSCPGSTSSPRRPASTRSSPGPTSSSPARAGSTPRPPSARPPSGSPGGPQAAGVRCIAVGGGVEPAGAAALEALGAEVVAVHERPIPLDEAIAAGVRPLVACGERLARSLGRLPGRDQGLVVIGPDFDDPVPEWDPDYWHPEDPLGEDRP